MNKKLTKDEFLSEIDNLFRSAHNGLLPHEEGFECTHEWCGKFYIQLKGIVEEHFKFEDMNQRVLMPILEILKRTKPRVSRGWVQRHLKKIYSVIPEAKLHMTIAWLKEIGVEVEND